MILKLSQSYILDRDGDKSKITFKDITRVDSDNINVLKISNESVLNESELLLNTDNETVWSYLEDKTFDVFGMNPAFRGKVPANKGSKGLGKATNDVGNKESTEL